MTALTNTDSAASVTTRVRPPSASGGALGWLRRNLFGSVLSSLVTVVFGAILLRMSWDAFGWLILHAVWTVPNGPAGPDTSSCQALAGRGACWAVVGEKWRFILFGCCWGNERWRAVD